MTGETALTAKVKLERLTDAGFDLATTGNSSPEEAAQKAAQQVGEMGCMEANAQPKKYENLEKYPTSGASKIYEHPREDSNQSSQPVAAANG